MKTASPARYSSDTMMVGMEDSLEKVFGSEKSISLDFTGNSGFRPLD
jgi:hypothetical protein